MPSHPNVAAAEQDLRDQVPAEPSFPPSQKRPRLASLGSLHTHASCVSSPQTIGLHRVQARRTWLILFGDSTLPVFHSRHEWTAWAQQAVGETEEQVRLLSVRRCPLARRYTSMPRPPSRCAGALRAVVVSVDEG